MCACIEHKTLSTFGLYQLSGFKPATIRFFGSNDARYRKISPNLHFKTVCSFIRHVKFVCYILTKWANLLLITSFDRFSTYSNYIYCLMFIWWHTCLGLCLLIRQHCNETYQQKLASKQTSLCKLRNDLKEENTCCLPSFTHHCHISVCFQFNETGSLLYTVSVFTLWQPFKLLIIQKKRDMTSS